MQIRSEAKDLAIQKLEQKDPVYLEHLARTQYNMVKPGEVEFRFENEN